MAFFISKLGNPQILLTDGGSLQLGDGLEIDIDNETLNVTGGGGSAPSFSNITGDPEDNAKLADILNNCVKKDDTDLEKLLNGENDNYLRQEVEGLTISSALNDLNSRVEVLERKLAQAGA